MTRISMKTIRELNEADLQSKIQEARSEYGKLKAEDSQGTIRKKSGKIKPMRRDIARMMTRLNELKKK